LQILLCLRNYNDSSAATVFKQFNFGFLSVTFMEKIDLGSPCGMPDPRTAATAILATTEAGATRTAAEATEAAAKGGRVPGPEAVTGLAGRQICLHRRCRSVLEQSVSSQFYFLHVLFKLFMLLIVYFLL
jgi:hypothetical protein